MKHVIILPVRNGSPYLGAAIDSILAQTCAEWRLVVLENASTDDTLEVLSLYSDPRISVMNATRPLSIVENWRRGYEVLAQDEYDGTFVTFIGHDDVFYPDFLTSINELIDEAPAATLYQSLFDIIDENSARVRPCRPVPRVEAAIGFIQARAWGLRDSFGTGYVFRRSDYLRVGGIPSFPSLLFADDLLFARLTALGYKACVQTIQCAYRLHTGSASGTMTPAKLNAHVEALASYVGAVEREFAEIGRPSPERYALARLLARESMLYGSPVTQWALTPQNRAHAADLLNVFDRLSEGGPWRDRGLPSGARLLVRRLRLAGQLVKATTG